MLEKSLIAVPAQVFTADGDINGNIFIVDTTLFKVGQIVIVSAIGQVNLQLEVKRINSVTNMVVGPATGNQLDVIDISAYTVASSAYVLAFEQNRPLIPIDQITRYTYEEEPVVANRVILVDKLGSAFRVEVSMVKIGFSTTNMFLSRLIRWVTRAKVSHVWFLIEMYGKLFVLQADIGGITITPLSDYDKKWTIIEIVTPKQDIDLAPAWELLGQKYDYAGLLGCAWVYIGRWLKKKWKNPLASGHAMFCSEYIVDVLQADKYPNTQGLIPSSVSPEDLLELLKE